MARKGSPKWSIYIYPLQCGYRRQFSESDVCRRQIIRTEVDTRAVIYFYLSWSNNIVIQMNQKELTKTFMMIWNWNKPFGLHEFTEIFQRFKGCALLLSIDFTL